MKRLIIFEGIATSGKTTLINLLAQQLDKVVVISEAVTLLPLFENRSTNVAINFLKTQLQEFDRCDADILIVDRFHFTHAFRTGSFLAVFHEIENELKQLFDARIIFLHIDDSVVESRVVETDNFRGDSWINKKQGSIQERTAYYVEQQQFLSRLGQESALPVLSINTSDKNWESAVTTIILTL